MSKQDAGWAPFLVVVAMTACHAPPLASVSNEVNEINAARYRTALDAAMRSHAWTRVDAEPIRLMLGADVRRCNDSSAPTATERMVTLEPNGARDAVDVLACEVGDLARGGRIDVAARASDGGRVTLVAAGWLGEDSVRRVLARARDGHLVLLSLVMNEVEQRAAYRPGHCDHMPSPVELFPGQPIDVYRLAGDVGRIENVTVSYDGIGIRVRCDVDTY